MKIKISPGNSKLGNIPNLSLPPILSCRQDVPCHKDCYAQKSYRMYPNVRKAWDGNLAVYQASPQKYFEQLEVWLIKHRPQWMRIHVSGDCPDAEYFLRLKATCSGFLETKFLMFTKCYGLDFNDISPNFSVVLSTWPGMELPANTDLPRAWMQDGTETRIPISAWECPGTCQTCSACWSLKKIGTDVFFRKH